MKRAIAALLSQHGLTYSFRLDGKTLTIQEWDPEADHVAPHELGIDPDIILRIEPKPPWRAVDGGTRWYFYRSISDGGVVRPVVAT